MTRDKRATQVKKKWACKREAARGEQPRARDGKGIVISCTTSDGGVVPASGALWYYEDLGRVLTKRGTAPMCEVLWRPRGGGTGVVVDHWALLPHPREKSRTSSQRGTGHEVGPWRSADEGVAVRTSGWARRPDAGERLKERWRGGGRGGAPPRDLRAGIKYYISRVSPARGDRDPPERRSCIMP